MGGVLIANSTHALVQLLLRPDTPKPSHTLGSGSRRGRFAHPGSSRNDMRLAGQYFLQRFSRYFSDGVLLHVGKLRGPGNYGCCSLW